LSKTNYRLRDEKYYFKNGITWGRITSSDISFRTVNDITLFGDAGPIFFAKSNLNYILGFLNFKDIQLFLSLINPTLNFQVSDLRSIPIMIGRVNIIEDLVDRNIVISRYEWNSRETSWDFLQNELIRLNREENLSS